MHILVLMSGGFHPFHPGHLALYNSAKQTFPGGDVVVGATNVQKDRPFDFKDKQTLATIAGVDKGHFVEVNRQFSVKGEPNIENRIQDPDNTILIFVRSKKDENDPKLQPWKLNPDGSIPMTKGSKNVPPRPTSDYLLPYEGNQKKLEPMTKHAYIAFLPVKAFGPSMTSATQIRNTWPTLDNQGKQQFAMGLYPATQNNSKLLKTVIDILNRNLNGIAQANIEPKQNIKKLKDKKLAESLTNLINNARPLIKEASPEQKLKLMKLMKEAISFKIGKHKTEPEVEKTDDEQEQLGYDHLFKPKEPPKQLPKVYHGWEEYEKDKEVDETRIYYTDSKTRVNLYYIPPKLKAQGKVQNIAHNIPYSTVEALIEKLCEKYNISNEWFTWIPVNADRTGTNIKDISEDYLDEK